MTGGQELAQSAIELLENARKTAVTPGYNRHPTAQSVMRTAVCRVEHLARKALQPQPSAPGSHASGMVALRIVNLLPRRIYLHRWTSHELGGLIGEIRKIAGLPAEGAATDARDGALS